MTISMLSPSPRSRVPFQCEIGIRAARRGVIRGAAVQWQYRNCNSGGVDTSTTFVFRYALNTMTACFALQGACSLTGYVESDCAPIAAIGDDAVLSALAGGQANIAAHQVLREEACVCPAFGGTDLEAMCHIGSPYRPRKCGCSMDRQLLYLSQHAKIRSSLNLEVRNTWIILYGRLYISCE